MSALQRLGSVDLDPAMKKGHLSWNGHLGKWKVTASQLPGKSLSATGGAGGLLGAEQAHHSQKAAYIMSFGQKLRRGHDAGVLGQGREQRELGKSLRMRCRAEPLAGAPNRAIGPDGFADAPPTPDFRAPVLDPDKQINCAGWNHLETAQP